MIFIGTVNLTRTRDQGNFLCPACGVSQGYRLRATRAWLTVYFIPTIPVSNHEPFVQCDHCKANWDPSVLEMDHLHYSDVAEEQFGEEAVRAAVLVVLADNQITENEINSLQAIASYLMRRPVGRDELGQVCSSARQHRIEPVNYVLTVSRPWNQKQRLRALQAMFLAAAADGPLGQLQIEILASMQELFDLTDAEYHRAIEQAVEWSSDG
ncbi:MAG: zinc-ribbon domain-containing protein [Rhodopirellula sp.]|nr:zinc-ribbon domain-containing protein [Rhodopirellula sp.]